MKKFHFKHSLKNIPLGNRKQYHSIMISKVESLIQRMRWKLIAIKSDTVNQENHYGFKTTNTAPQIDELKPFEDDVYKLITSIEFKKVNLKYLIVQQSICWLIFLLNLFREDFSRCLVQSLWGRWT